MSYILLIFRFLRTNIIQTVWLNFRMLPFKQAIRMPIFVYGKFRLRGHKGRIVITRPVRAEMIIIGKNTSYVSTAVQRTIWTINGTLTFAGPMRFAFGSYLLVSDEASLSFGTDGTYCGTNFKVFCFDRIDIGDNVRIAWDVQIMDSSFHYTRNLNREGQIEPLTRPIRLEGNIWVGNRSTIAKGTVLPNETIIASNSLVNKDFSSLPPYSMLAGSPAKLCVSGIRRIWSEEEQAALDQKLHYHRTHL